MLYCIHIYKIIIVNYNFFFKRKSKPKDEAGTEKNHRETRPDADQL